MMDTWVLLLSALLILVFAVLWRRAEAGRLNLADRCRDEAFSHQQQLSDLSFQSQALKAAASVTGDLLLILDSDLLVRYANSPARQVFGDPGEADTVMAFIHSLALENLVREAQDSPGNEILMQGIELLDVPYNVRVLCSQDLIAVSLTNAAELRRLSRARQDLITNLSHEIRTPLTSIRLIADTMRSPAGRDPELTGTLTTRMIHEVDELNQMAEEMLDLAAIEAGRQVVRLVQAGLGDITASPIERISEQALQKLVQIECLIPDSIRVLADREQAGRAILNVLHNAVKFSPAGGTITLQAFSDDAQGQAVLQISDEGDGIAPHELQRIFERFYRSEQARHTPGTGLGLAIARHIMQAHGGDISAENRILPERGTTFSLTFQTAPA